MLDPGAGRILAKEVIAFPVPGWPDWPWHETATAIRTHIAQNAFDTLSAKRALVAANTRLKRVGRQRLVAVLTAGS